MPDFITIPQTLTRFRLANARVPVCLVADAAQLKPDADGLAPCDIVIDKERIAAIDPAAAANDGLPRFDLDQRHRAAASRRRAHPHRQGPHLGSARRTPTARTWARAPP